MCCVARPPRSVSRELLGDLFVRLPLGLWHAREREPAEEGRERHEDEVGVAAERTEDEREGGRHHQVGDPVERLPDARQRVLGVHGHDLRDDEALDVAHAHGEGDDRQHHRHNLRAGHESGEEAEDVAERAGDVDGTEATAHAHPRAHEQGAAACLVHDGEGDEGHGDVDEGEEEGGELRVGDVGVAEHERRVVEDGVDAAELHADLDYDADHHLLP
mmetsp:Transcript_7441/g.17489  ORF Transcript_7441/g.17489 Transcript_7441/m.17489 type:complete len:217 (+) Transcript_7441:74-724(+)